MLCYTEKLEAARAHAGAWAIAVAKEMWIGAYKRRHRYKQV